MQIKNLSHRYEGYLGNTYSNCLRIAVIRGYAHYGLDANEHVEKQTGKACHVASNNNNGLLMSVQQQHPVGQNDDVGIEPVVYMDEVFQGPIFSKILQLKAILNYKEALQLDRIKMTENVLVT